MIALQGPQKFPLRRFLAPRHNSANTTEDVLTSPLTDSMRCGGAPSADRQ